MVLKNCIEKYYVSYYCTVIRYYSFHGLPNSNSIIMYYYLLKNNNCQPERCKKIIKNNCKNEFSVFHPYLCASNVRQNQIEEEKPAVFET